MIRKEKDVRAISQCSRLGKVNSSVTPDYSTGSMPAHLKTGLRKGGLCKPSAVPSLQPSSQPTDFFASMQQA